MLKDFIMSKLAELQAETREIIEDLLNDGSDPNALYIIEHHIAHHDFDLLEKIAVDAFKAGYEVSEAEEFKDDDGRPIFCFDIISEVELKAEIIDAQQKEILPLLEKHNGIYDGWGTYFENPNADHDEYGDDVEFFDDDDDEYGDDVEFFDDDDDEYGDDGEFFDADDDEYGDDGEFFDDDDEEETRVH